MAEDFEIQRGDDWEGEIPLTRNGVAYDLTGVQEIWLTLRPKPARPGVDTTDSSTGDNPVVAQLTLTAGEIVVVDAANGLVDLNMPKEKTSLLVRSQYAYDVQIRRSDGKIKTVKDASGIVPILDQVTVSV